MLEAAPKPTDGASGAAAWERVLLCATEKQDRPSLKRALVDFSMALISHDFQGSRYRSALLSFCSMYSMKPHTLTWREPGNFSSFLSGIIWAVQLIIFYVCVRGGDDDVDAGDDAESSALARIEACCYKVLRPDTETPMGEILGWRLLLTAISKQAVGTHQATWDEDEKIVTYRDIDLHMDHIQQLLQHEFGRAKRLLYDELMFSAKDLPRVQAAALHDNLDADAYGWYFGQHWKNVDLLEPLSGPLSLQAVIRRSKPLRDHFLDVADDGVTVTWRARAIAHYEAIVADLLASFAVLFHIGNGQPVRESELFSITYRNTQRRRSVYIKHHRVMLHIQYHKGQQQMGRYKDNIRFLHPTMGDLFIDYINYVLPLRQVFLRHSAPRAVISPYLWSNKDGQVWGDNRLTQCIRQACARAKIPRLSIASWRQITVNIVKIKFGAADIKYFDVGRGDGADGGSEGEEVDEDVRAMTSQRNHSTWTVNRAYANQLNNNFGNVWDGLIRRSLRASVLWQELWGLDRLLMHSSPDGSRKRKRSVEPAVGVAPQDYRPQMLKRLSMGRYRQRRQWSAAALLKGARALYRDPKLRWKSEAQRRAMTTLMSRTEQVVAVLPTGAGKSLLFMLPCTLPGAGLTILILPLVSLRGDLLRRVRELGIDHWIWTAGGEDGGDGRLVFVTAEAACTTGFREFAHRMAATQELDCIVLDEAHLTVTASEYRRAMVDVGTIRTVRTQFLYLTATLPPAMQTRFEEQNNLVNPKVVRASANRSNMFYMVQQYAARPGESLLEEGARRARDAWRNSGLVSPARDKIILYVRTRDEAGELAGLLGCRAYTAKAARTAREKEELLEDWTSTPEQPYLVATSALSAGFDYAHVRLVMHVGEPNSLVDFAQESGRAGRDGGQCYSAVLLPGSWRPGTEPGAARVHDDCVDVRDREALDGYLAGSVCRRASLSAYLDVEADRRQCCVEGEDVACDVCSGGGKKSCETQDARSSSRSNSAELEPCGSPIAHTGSQAVAEKQHAAHLELSRYEEDLLAVQGTCLLCRGLGERWDHLFDGCSRRFDFFEARDRARQKGQEKGGWIRAYHACFWCLNPQSICGRADPESGVKSCRFHDMVLPLCYGQFHKPEGRQWLARQFDKRDFIDLDGFLSWCGQGTRFGGGKAIWAVRVAATLLLQLELY